MTDHVVEQELYGDEHQRNRGQAGRKPNVALFLTCHLKARAARYTVAAHAALTLE